MGVFGEKHTSLTREQKRQLIHQADTHKLRPTEVCDWVQATWGLRIARVTVYSILHKQRASLMAGHKDLYQTMQNSLSGSASSPQTAGGQSSASSTELHQQQTTSSADISLGANKDSGRVNKYRASPNKSKGKPKETPHNKQNAIIDSNGSSTINKRNRSSSVLSDRSSNAMPLDGSGEGARWEGQLKRVREPASVELDRAMVEFLKSPASVDSQGRRLNDAELQSHALRLAQSIPSASRMRCSFGWLRHFKRRLGVQWAVDKLGKYRWVVEMDQQQQHQQQSEKFDLASATTFSIKQKQLVDRGRHGSATATEDDEEEYHSTYEFGSDGHEVTPDPSPRKRARTSNNLTSSMTRGNGAFSIQPPQQQQQQQQQQQSTTQGIMSTFPHLFGTLPPLHIPGNSSSMGTISPLATTLDPKLTTSNFAPSTPGSPSAFGMSVDGKMRKVPSKEEAYEMLQSLLMYYEQDHSYIGEQQTLLLPRWIHQQRQIMQQTQETESKMMWMRQQQQQSQHSYQTLYQPLLFPFHSMDPQCLSAEFHHPYHRYHSSFSSTSSVSSTLSSSPPSLSPMSPVCPPTPQSPTINPYSLGMSDSFASSKPELSSTLTNLEQQMLSDPSLLFSAPLHRHD